MKKIVYVITLLFIGIIIVKADNVAEFVPTLPNCVTLYEENQIIVPVNIKGIKSGLLSSKFSRYKIGRIYNEQDVKIDITDISNEKIKISVDKITDSDNKSDVYFTLSEDIEVSSLDDVLKFNIVYTFEELPKSVDVFDHKVYIYDSSICEYLNEGFQTYITKEEKSSNIVFYIIISILSIICVVLLSLLIRRNK